MGCVNTFNLETMNRLASDSEFLYTFKYIYSIGFFGKQQGKGLKSP